MDEMERWKKTQEPEARDGKLIYTDGNLGISFESNAHYLPPLPWLWSTK